MIHRTAGFAIASLGDMRAITVFLLFSLASAQLAAQGRDSLRTLLENAQRKNSFVRLTLMDSSVVQGRVPFVRDSTVTVFRRTLKLEDVRIADVRLTKPTAAKEVATVGALFGGGFGLLLSGLCYRDEWGCRLGIPLMLGVGGAGLGAFIGGVVRTGPPTWDRAWQQ